MKTGAKFEAHAYHSHQAIKVLKSIFVHLGTKYMFKKHTHTQTNRKIC